jgi:hypothetical protein
MEARIQSFAEIKLAGMRIKMSLTVVNTQEVWQNFMPGRREIKNNKSPALYSIRSI